MIKFGSFATFKYGKMPEKKKVTNTGKYPIYSGYRYVGFYDEYNIEAGQLIIVARGVGGAGDVKLTKEKCYLTNLSIHANIDERIALPKYLYYYFLPRNLRYLDSGSAQSQITISDLENVMIPLPPIDVQEKIAAILSPLDDKIELNRRINANLEEQARAIFKHWFIEREPSEKWQKGKLKDILNLKRNNIKAGGNEKLPYVPIDVIPMRTFALSEVRPNKEAKSSLITFSRDDIIIGAMRIYFHRVVLAPFNGITRTTCFTLRAFDDDYLSFCLLCCDQDSTINYAQSRSKGSTMPYAVWDGGLGDMDIIIPDKKTAREFNDIVLPMLRKIQASYNENNTLANIRDSLLPKLISGDIIP